MLARFFCCWSILLVRRGRGWYSITPEQSSRRVGREHMVTVWRAGTDWQIQL